MDPGKVAKFSVRVLISFALFAVGAAIFFTQEDSSMKTLGASFMTTVFGAWMSMGSSKIIGN